MASLFFMAPIEEGKRKNVTSNNHNSNVLEKPELIIDCQGLINRNDGELLKVKKLQSLNKKYSLSLSEGEISSSIASNSCPEFVTSRNYPSSASNSDFPLAYSLVLHKNPGQAERLLRAIYSPDNVYCLHIDAKTPEVIFKDFEALSSCFPNVFLAQKRKNVYWASYERLQADFNCMQELLEHEIQWRYLINLCGEDFPLKRNSEIVSYLKSVYPKNSIETFPMTVSWNLKKKIRYEKHWELHKYETESEYKFHPMMTDKDKSPPPGGIEIFSGIAYNFFTREFIQWALEDKDVRELIEWSKDTFSPDEFIWATIIRMKNAPGNEFIGKSTENLSRLILWQNNVKDHECQGYFRRNVCVFGSGDVGWLLRTPYFFANKFDAVDDFALQCLEEELRKEPEIKEDHD
ncbi:Oidioi.mRNA.OKI2018_I69.PAR.g9356.t1.cds [Oikopleura dioica]|uniref:Oidioi.mRNA.OKI2018_I69.PAR.g9356.t1.cds n=1 Tax=Oikopleura dioica TaxID=34765 RepID=A0ABN7RKB6_OIKDI|nr:Oidioi.mRNA.OKI2018_I69.PAR.g9356.t1.cds [Oikopleura dioica]